MAQTWGTNSAGGFMYSDELSDVLRMAVQPMVKFRQFCDAKDATNKGLSKGGSCRPVPLLSQYLIDKA